MTISGAEETFKKISPLIEAQFPAFIREEGPRFVSFLKAYYEFMEQSGQAVNATRSLIDNQDIDRTLDSFVEYFRREFMINLPKDVLADKRLLVKHIRDFYRTRGSKFSYDFLFYALFNKQIEIVYPGDFILRASDGRWVRETILRVGNPFSTLPTNLDGRNIVGSVSGATARVQKVTRVVVLGHPLFELLVENVVGVFVDGETISDDLGNNATITSAFGSLIGIEQVVDPGAFHQAGDSVIITSSGATALARVASTNDLGPVSFRINRGGSGYRLGETAIIVEGGSGTGAAAIVTSLSNTTFVSLNTNQIAPLSNVVLNTGATFVSLGTNTASVSANLAAANISSTLATSLTFANSVAGSINAISVTSVGINYVPELPTVTTRDQIVFELGIPGQAGRLQGDDAVIIPIRAPGAIASLGIISSDASFDKFSDAIVVNSRGNSPTIDENIDLTGINRFTIRNTTYDADIKPIIAGVITQPGRYIDTKGFLSWNMRLQDNDFYQEYSYLIKVTEIVDRYRDVVKRVLHPAGAKMFGSYQFVSNTNLSHNHGFIYSQEAILPITLSVDKASLISANVFITPESQSTGLTFSPSGKRMYVVGVNTDSVYQYKLSTEFDVSTAIYMNKSISIANTSDAGPGDKDPREVQFHPEGHTMYIVGIERKVVDQYSLSTAWDISTATYSSKSKDISAQDTSPQSLAFGDDGSKMYILGSTNDSVFQYELSEPWDVSTATYVSKFLSVASQENNPLAMVFSNDGKTVLVVGSTTDTVYQYTLSTAWDISTATYDNKSLDIGAQEATPHGIALSIDQKKMFILGSASDTVYTYQRST
jgi:hypothetical protein